MNDLTRIVAIMTTQADALAADRDLMDQIKADNDAAEVAEMDGRKRDTPEHGGRVLCHESARLEASACDHPSLPAPDDFSFDPRCRELAAHFLPDGDALDLDYFAQFIQDTVDEFLREKREFEERNYDPSPHCSSCGARTAAKCTCGGEANRDRMD